MIAIKNVLRDAFVYVNKEEIKLLNSDLIIGKFFECNGKFKGVLKIRTINENGAYMGMKKMTDSTGNVTYSLSLPKEMYEPLQQNGQTSTSIYYQDTKGYQTVWLKEFSTLSAFEKSRLEKILEKNK